jgi:hypothetical protein
VKTLLIDDDGAIWPATRGVLVKIDSPQRRHRELAIAATDRGWILFRPMRMAAFVGFHPYFATDRSLFRVYNLLIQQKPSRVVISYDETLSSYEMLTGTSRAILRIEEVVHDARQPQPRTLLTEMRLHLDQVGTIAQGRLLPPLRIWEEARHRWRPSLYEWLQKNNYLGYSRVVRVPRGSERLRIEHWGSSRAIYDRNWARIAQGRDLEEQPNRDVAMWRAGTFRQIIAAEQPSLGFDDIVAARADGHIVRVQLRRLILPWRCENGDIVVSAIHTNPRTITHGSARRV